MFWRMLFMYFFIIKKYNDSTTKAKYLGFAFYYQFQEKKYRMKVPKKSLDKVKKKVRKLTSRKWSVSNSYKAKKIAEVVRGWINYFKIGSILTVSRKLDTVIRYRFRMCIWKHWKNPKTRYKNLVKLGISKKNARCAAGFHWYAWVCRTKTVCYAMSNARLKKFGLLSAEEYLCKARCQVNWTAGCGTACPVVWEVGGGSRLLLDQRHLLFKKSWKGKFPLFLIFLLICAR